MSRNVIVASIVAVLLLPMLANAQEEFSLELTGITFSRDPILEGDLVRIYARVFNNSQDDISGFVVFANDGKAIGTPQPISLKPNTYDDAFIDWRAGAGTHGIEAKILESDTGRTTPEATAKKEIVVQQDNNHNGVGDATEAVGHSPKIEAKTSQESKKVTEAVIQKTSGVLSKVGQALAQFAENNPVKKGIETVTNIVNGKASALNSAFTRSPGGNEEKPAKNNYRIDYSKQTASLYDSGLGYLKRNQRFIYLGLSALLLSALLYVLFKRKPAPPLE